MFDIFEYVANIERRLEFLDERKSAAFAVWCTEPLFQEFKGYLEIKIGVREVSLFDQFLKVSWEYVLTGKKVEPDLLEKVKTSCEAASWEEEIDTPESQMFDAGAIETIEAILLLQGGLKENSPKLFAQTAEKIINRIDFELNMILGVNDPFSNQIMKDEINRQQKIIEHLENSDNVNENAKNFY